MTKDAVATMGAVLPDDAGGRDAVHVAVISAVAGEKLVPGQDVGFSDQLSGTGENVATAGASKMLGIVDPFIDGIVRINQRFWLYIYPRKITGLNHQWSHPDIPDATKAAPSNSIYNTPSQKLTSEQWLRDFCSKADCPGYEETVAGALRAVSHGEEYVHFNDIDAHGEIPDEFWDHLSIVTGRKIEGERPKYFSCSC